MAPSRKRKITAPVDGDTREVKRRDTAASSSTSHDYCESPTAAQEIPWGPMYEDVDDDDDGDEFTFSPASPPPLTQTTKEEEEEEDAKTAPPTLYVFPDSTVVLTPDGGCVRIPDQPANQPEPSTMEEEEEEEEEPSTDQDHASNLNTKVCIIMMEEAISHIITKEWRKSSTTLDEVTTDVCHSITSTILSAVFHELMMAYARINIRRQP